MAVINISAAGNTGVHTFEKVNVNLDDEYVYFSGNGTEVIPPAIANNTAYIFSYGVGSISGIASGDLVYSRISNAGKTL
jgi:hypothetical protein